MGDNRLDRNIISTDGCSVFDSVGGHMLPELQQACIRQAWQPFPSCDCKAHHSSLMEIMSTVTKLRLSAVSAKVEGLLPLFTATKMGVWQGN